MPRRDAISEKKRERLAQEQAQLQQLMLQAHSSVRRTSLKSDDDLRFIDDQAQTEQHSGNNIVSDEKFSADDFETRPETKRFEHESENAMPAAESEATVISKNGRSITINHPDTNQEQPALNTIPAWENEKAEADPIAPVLRSENNDSELFQNPMPLERTRPKPSRKIMAATAVLVLIAGVALYFNQSGKAGLQTSQTTASNKSGNLSNAANPAALSDSLKIDSIASANSPVTANVKTKNAAKPTNEASTKNAATEIKTKPAQVNEKGAYTVVSKAYFHDAPDASTRRKAFIIHWNKAVLLPLDEKNGFVYIVFTNHLGQTSKGWLPKKDLRKLN